MAAADQLAGLSSLINLVKGSSSTTKTSGGTTTQQTNVSDQGVNQLIQQILSGSGGVKTIGNRARSSGLYNSTGEDILLGNLYATAANQAELARTPTVTTTAPTVTKTEGTKVGAGDLATGLAGTFIASQLLNIGGKALAPAVDAGTNYVTDLVGQLFGVSSGEGTSSTGKKGAGDFDFGGYGAFGTDAGSTSTGISTGEGYGINTSTLGNFGGSSSVPGAVGLNFGIDADTGAGSVGIGGLGGLLGGLLSSVGGGGGRGGSSGGSVICTALKDLGLLDKELHAAGSKYLNSMNPITVIGYQVWGNKIADKIREGHKGWTKVALPIARSRTALLASSGSIVDHFKNPLGTLTKFIGEPICHVIGLCVPDDLFIPMMYAYLNQKGV